MPAAFSIVAELAECIARSGIVEEGGNPHGGACKNGIPRGLHVSENTSNAPMPPPGNFDHLGKILPGAFGDCAADLGGFGVWFEIPHTNQRLTRNFIFFVLVC